MPTYDYECTNCGHSFDTFQNMSDAPLTECPVCERSALKRLIGGGAGIIFKGSGFYVNDSRGASKSASSRSDSGSADGTGSTESASDGSGGTKSSSSDGASSSSDGKKSEGNGSKSGNSESKKSDAAVSSSK